MAKLGFVHRTLWRRDAAYRWAVLLGPPPLLGCALAAGVLAAVARMPAAPEPTVPWAQWTRAVPRDEQPFTEAPAAPLPRLDAAGKPVGLQAGWLGSIQPLTVDATMDANVGSTALASFVVGEAAIPLARVQEAGDRDGLFVGTAKTFLVARTAGTYGLSVRMRYAGAQPASCMVRMQSATHRIQRNVHLEVLPGGVLQYPATEFRLEPGLYPLAVALGCWRNNQVVGPGELTLLVRPPGAAGLRPATAEEVLRPAAAGP